MGQHSVCGDEIMDRLDTNTGQQMAGRGSPFSSTELAPRIQRTSKGGAAAKGMRGNALLRGEPYGAAIGSPRVAQESLAVACHTSARAGLLSEHAVSLVIPPPSAPSLPQQGRGEQLAGVGGLQQEQPLLHRAAGGSEDGLAAH